jgi:protein SCO1
LFCYQYDPATGQYGLVIMNVLRLAGLMTVVVLGGFMIAMFRHERHKLKDRSG